MPGDSKQTTTTAAAPWGPAQPALKYSLDKALQYAKKGVGGDIYTGSTVTPWDVQTKKGMGFIQRGANENLAGKGLSGQYQDVINQGGYTDEQRRAADVLQGVMGGSGLTPEQEAAMRSAQGMLGGEGLSSAQQRALGGLQSLSDNPFNAYQQAALGGIGNTIASGGYNDATRAAQNSALAMLGGSGLSAAQQSALGGIQGLAANPFNAYQQSALQNVQGLANSNFDVNANPAFQDVLRQAQGAARESVNMGAGGAGRYGGGVHQGNLAREVGDLTSRMVGGEYQNWQARRDAANANLFNMGQTGIGTQLAANQGAAGIGQQGIGNLQAAQSNAYNMGQGALGNLANALSSQFNMGQAGIGTQMAANQGAAGIGQQGIGNLQNAQSNVFNMGQTGLTNRTGAAQNLSAMGQQALGNLGTAYTGMQAPAQDLMKIGAMNEDLATRRMNDRLRIFNETQNKPWEQLGRLNAIASGAGQMGGTTTQTAPGQNPFLTALGYGSGVGGLLGSFI